METPIKIIGTSHISTQSVREITAAFDEFDPDVIAVELDKRRLQSLLDRQKGAKQHIPLSMVRRVGITGYLFLVLGSWLQQKLAGIVKVDPGVDMMQAMVLAKKHEKMLLLVDQDVFITMKRLNKAFTFREKLRVIWDVLRSPFQKTIKVRLDKVPSKKVIRELMSVMKERYPGLYKPLVLERNVHMCVQLDKFARKHPGKKILLVVGAGHEEDLRDRLVRSELFSVR